MRVAVIGLGLIGGSLALAATYQGRGRGSYGEIESRTVFHAPSGSRCRSRQRVPFGVCSRSVS